MSDAHETPPRVKPALIHAPRIREQYWCNFPKDAQLPEFWKVRPVVILSYRQRLYDTVTVIPCSTQTQTSKFAFPLRTTIDGRAAWAICDKLTTVAVSRLVPDKRGIARMGEAEFNELLAVVFDWLPKIS